MANAAQFGALNIADGTKNFFASGNVASATVETLTGPPIAIKATIKPTVPLTSDNTTALIVNVFNGSTRTAMKYSTAILPSGDFEITFNLDAAGDDFRITWCAGHFSALSGSITGTY